MNQCLSNKIHMDFLSDINILIKNIKINPLLTNKTLIYKFVDEKYEQSSDDG